MKPFSVINEGTVVVSLERRLAILSKLGFKLAPAFNVDELLKSFPRKSYEESGFDLALIGLGMTEQGKLRRNHCENLRLFDTECINNTGDYSRIARDMMGITQGSLVLENIQDEVDNDNRTAWLAFDFKGERIKIDCEVNDNRVDASIFTIFTELLDEADPEKTFVVYNAFGLNTLIGCVTKEQLEILNEHELHFSPLT